MSYMSDIGYVPENEVRIRGKVTGIDPVRPARFGGEYVSFTVYAARPGKGGDQVSCFALNEEACEFEAHVKVGDVVHVEGALRVNAKSGAVGVMVRVWWLEDGEEPLTPEEREAERRRVYKELERQRLSIGSFLPPPDMDGVEEAAWTFAFLYRGEWENKWKEVQGIEAADDYRIRRVFELLSADRDEPVEAGSS